MDSVFSSVRGWDLNPELQCKVIDVITVVPRVLQEPGESLILVFTGHWGPKVRHNPSSKELRRRATLCTEGMQVGMAL